MHFILNMHGIGQPHKFVAEEERRFWIAETKFVALLSLLGKLSESHVELTFDDGNKSDIEIAAPLLKSFGRRAIFFVLAGRLGHCRYLSRDDVRQLHFDGFEIGSHGIDHVSWPSLTEVALSREIHGSKLLFEQIINQEVRSAAIPFGEYNGRVLNRIARSQYRCVYSSDGGPRLTSNSPVPRYSVKVDTDLDVLASTIINSRKLLPRLNVELRSIAKGYIW